MFMIPFQRSAERSAFPAVDGALSTLERLFDPEEGGFIPSLDVKETPTEYTVSADLPGLDRKDLQVRVEEGVLVISGERKAEHQEEAKDRTWLRVERSWGSFERRLRLGDGVDPDKVAARYQDGVLTVTVPKTAGALPRRIEVA